MLSKDGYVKVNRRFNTAMLVLMTLYGRSIIIDPLCTCTVYTKQVS